jgi:hypothetical protein
MGVTEALEVVAAALVDGATYLGTGRAWPTMLVAAIACAYFAHAWVWGKEPKPEPLEPVDVINLKGGGKAFIPNPGRTQRVRPAGAVVPQPLKKVS